MNKKSALIAALLTTAVVAIAMLMIGISAYINPDSVPVASANSAAGNTTAISAPAATDQVAQLQSLLAQYQSREQQYQDQLNQADTQVQQYQQILQQLQQRGLITINNNGQISISRRRD